MSKRRKKKDFRPKHSVKPAQEIAPEATPESTPEPVVVATSHAEEEEAAAAESIATEPAPAETLAEEPVALAEETPSVASIDTTVRGRSDSLEPVAFQALEIEHVEEEETNARPAPRAPSRFVPMVKTIVATCGAIALLAVVRVGVARSHAWHAPVTTHAAAAAPPAPPPGADVPAPPEEEAVVVAADENVSDVDPALAVTLAKRAQIKLETRQVDDAIELGEQAVSHDAKNANAWIVLGAAYQQKGDLTSATRCYKMCVAGTPIPGDKSREDCANLLKK